MGELPQPTLRVAYERRADTHLISLVGEMDMSNVDAAREPIINAIEDREGGAVIVDMSELRFIDSTGIRLLLEVQAASRSDSDRLCFRGVRDEVAQVLRVTGVDESLELTD